MSSPIRPMDGGPPRSPKNELLLSRSRSSGDKGSGVKEAKVPACVSLASKEEISTPCRLMGLLRLCVIRAPLGGGPTVGSAICCGILAQRRSIS